MNKKKKSFNKLCLAQLAFTLKTKSNPNGLRNV